jgi:zinc protease
VTTALTTTFPGLVRYLDNGVTLIVRTVPTSQVVTADLWIRSGARTEVPEQSGISHFLEHMIFKGTSRIAPGEFDRRIEGRGGVTNAATSQDYTHYHITVAQRDYAEALPLLADLVCNARIPEDEFEQERLVVLEEIRRSQDNPDRTAYDLLTTNSYKDHPYARPVLGYPETLMNMTPEIMRQFHRSRYQPGALTVVLVGGLPERELLEVAEPIFSQLPVHKEEAAHAQVAPVLPLTQSTRIEQPQARIENSRLLIGFVGPSAAQPDDILALEVISVILTEGRTARLTRELREEKGWVRYIGSYCGFSHDPGLFTFSAQMDRQYVASVEAAIYQQIEQIQQGAFSEEELQRAKSMLLNDFIFGTETPSQLAALYGYYQTVAELDLALLYPEQLKNLGAEALVQAAKKYLNPDKAVVIALHPEEAPSAEASEEARKEETQHA